jgi:hypothetical protein
MCQNIRSIFLSWNFSWCLKAWDNGWKPHILRIGVTTSKTGLCRKIVTQPIGHYLSPMQAGTSSSWKWKSLECPLHPLCSHVLQLSELFSYEDCLPKRESPPTLLLEFADSAPWSLALVPYTLSELAWGLKCVSWGLKATQP